MICRRTHCVIARYPVNKNVPSEARSLGEILAIYEKTGQLVAPTIEGGFEVDADENGRANFPESSTDMYQSKIALAKAQRDALFPSAESSGEAGE